MGTPKQVSLIRGKPPHGCVPAFPMLSLVASKLHLEDLSGLGFRGLGFRVQALAIPCPQNRILVSSYESDRIRILGDGLTTVIKKR